jgi:hypothetical protein
LSRILSLTDGGFTLAAGSLRPWDRSSSFSITVNMVIDLAQDVATAQGLLLPGYCVPLAVGQFFSRQGRIVLLQVASHELLAAVRYLVDDRSRHALTDL